MRLKKAILNFRVILLLIFLVFALFTIKPNPWNEGVTIRSIDQGSAAADAGISSPLSTDKPMNREIIKEINGQEVNNVEDFNRLTADLEINDTLIIKTKSHFVKEGDQRTYHMFAEELEYIVLIQEKTNIETTTQFNNETNQNETVQIITPLGEPQELGLTVYNAPKTNIKKGLDLEGGTRVLLQPQESVSPDDLEIINANLKQRLNVYGLSDIIIRSSGDFLEGNQYISVEIAGATQNEVKDLVSQQGKFEAKIGNEIVFRGGTEDIVSVCRTPECSFAVDPNTGCGSLGDGTYQCSFSFAVTLSKEAADKHAEITKDLAIVDGNYLEKDLELYLDDELVDTLRISSGLKGRSQQQISISGPGVGRSIQEAQVNSAQNMKALQTVLVTGSLPVKLDIVKVDTISPSLGQEFLDNAIIVAIAAILAVSIIIYIRYRSLKISIPMLLTMVSEVILILWFAALVGWNIDLAAIAGIIIAVGTGVDDQIVITDETLGKQAKRLNWKQKLKKAFFIIMAAYFTTLVAMLPLWSAGAGLLRGFAITTIVGITFGVLVTRPAFAKIVENLVDDEN